MQSWFDSFEDKAFSIFDAILIVVSVFGLIASLFIKTSWPHGVLAVLSFVGLMPVIYSAFKSIMDKKLSVDLLAAIALIFSLIANEWASATFITLMLAFARLFDRITDIRAKRIIRSLMKYHVESVRVRIGDTIKEVHISQVKKDDVVMVESGDRMPVDGVVISGTADVDESSLTGESELVPKKVGDRVYTATVSDSGSLVVRTEKVGADSTLSRIISLIDEASRSKNKAEKTADKFTQWYILLALLASGIMYYVGLSPREILSVLLVVCADDIAVAVPLAFTAAITHSARRGVIVKGSTALEQLSRLKYIMTDKTGTLTRGKPKVVDIKGYGKWTQEEILERCATAASVSRHMVSRAVTEYIEAKGMKAHAPDEADELPGQGIIFSRGGEKMRFGRLSFMEQEKMSIPDHIKRDLEIEKEAGRGTAVLSVGDEVVGLLSYRDELRPRVKEIIAETETLGVKEWHMLTGDSERVAKAVSAELGIKHFHANMTPETKVAFISKFERSHEPEVVGYIGDGVNDAASLALADVSIAMGGIGSDAAIEAADITIMKDKLSRIPEIMQISQKVMNVMWWNFAIWGITNTIGLGLVAFGYIGPAGAATYNFLTDFLPIANSMRAGRTKKILPYKDPIKPTKN